MLDLGKCAQIICLIIYSLISLWGAFIATKNRDAFKGINRAKELLPQGASLDSSDDLPSSFSRTVGLAGAIGLTGFMWCIGFLLLAGSPIIAQSGWSDSLQQFVLACSALFAPYAFNRLSQLFTQVPSSIAGSNAAVRAPSPKAIPTPTGLVGQ